MTIRQFSLAFALTTVLSACASTSDDDPASASASAEGASQRAEQNASLADDDPDKVTCKRSTKPGSRMRTKVCKTNRRWLEEQQDAEDAAELIQRQSVQSPTFN